MAKKSWGRAATEVLLIAAGVLLGLAGDEWRQSIERSQREADLLSELRVEFLANRDELEGVGISTVRYRDASLFLLNPDSIDGASPEALVETIRLVLSQGSTFTPQTGTLTNYLGGADPGIISNPQLRAALADWPRRVEDLGIQETRASDFIHGDARDFIVEDGDLPTLLAGRRLAPGREADPVSLEIRELVARAPAFDWVTKTRSQRFRNLAATRLRLAIGILSKHEDVLEAHMRVLELLDKELSAEAGSL